MRRRRTGSSARSTGRNFTRWCAATARATVSASRRATSRTTKARGCARLPARMRPSSARSRRRRRRSRGQHRDEPGRGVGAGGCHRARQPVAALGGVHAERAGRAARARGIAARDGRGAGAPERTRRLRAARRRDLALGRTIHRDHGVGAERERPVLRSRGGQGVPASAVLQGATGRAGSMTAPSVVPVSPEAPNGLFELLLRLGDDRLVLGHRLSEWCGHGPILEEDIAISNVALDLLGQATMFLRLAGEVEGKGRDEDALAYFREVVEFRNAQIVELPKGDFAFTIARQFLFDVYSVVLLDALSSSSHAELAAIAAKSLKEAKYHVRHSGEWILKLGDGTDESHRRVQRALDDLWRFTPELFAVDDIETEMNAAGVAPDMSALRTQWEQIVRDVVARATLSLPNELPNPGHARSGRTGAHTESLGHMLAEMQIVARSHPGAKW